MGGAAIFLLIVLMVYTYMQGSQGRHGSSQDPEASDESFNGSNVMYGISSMGDSEDDFQPYSPICHKQTRKMRSKK
jgi:hypothetical protein